jgi:hypothetical protein
MDNWYQIEQQSNTEAKQMCLEQVFYFRVGVGSGILYGVAIIGILNFRNVL